MLPADGGLSLTGKAPNKQICYLSLWNENETRQYTQKEVKGNFETTFTVAPCGGNYTIKAVCNEKLTKTYKVGENDEASYKKPYQLGNISP